MGKIKPNNLEKAQKEFDSIEGKEKNSIPSEIAEADKDSFVAALVKISVVGKKAFKGVSIQQFNAQSFEKIQKNFKFLGIDKIIVLHDPTVQEGEKETKQEAGAPATGTKFNNFRVDELKKFAEENNVDLQGKHLKDDLVEILTKWETEKATETPEE